MKKIISLLLALSLSCAILASCGDVADNNSTDGTTDAQTTTTDAQGTTTTNTVKPGDGPADPAYGLNGETPSDLSLFKYEDLDDGTVKIKGTYIDKANAQEKLVVPAVIDGKKVTIIGESAFASLNKVKTIIVSGYVTEIQAYAFRDCTAMTSLKLPEGITTIGQGAFSGCTGFTTIDFIPNTVTKMGERVFENCTTTTKIIMPDSVTEVGGYTFVGCNSLTEVVISKNLKAIPERMFMGCSMLGKGVDGFVLAIPEGVTKIGAYAFNDCGQVQTITIPNGVKEIGKNAFDGCKRVATLEIPDTCTKIGDEAFNNCSSLTSLVLPAGADVKIGAGIINLKNTKKVAITVVNGSAAHTWVTENIAPQLASYPKASIVVK